jgi:Domain of unknown function (DUF4402)
MAVSLGLLGAPAMAGNQQSDVNANVLQPLQIINISDLRFGTILRGTTAGTVTVNASTSARTKTGTATGPTLVGNDGAPAQFLTYGGPLQTLQVTRGPLPVLTRQGGGGTMNVTQLTLNGPVTRFLNGAGILDLRVGGRLSVGANQPSGRYSGTFDITVTYF